MARTTTTPIKIFWAIISNFTKLLKKSLIPLFLKQKLSYFIWGTGNKK